MESGNKQNGLRDLKMGACSAGVGSLEVAVVTVVVVVVVVVTKIMAGVHSFIHRSVGPFPLSPLPPPPRII